MKTVIRVAAALLLTAAVISCAGGGNAAEPAVRTVKTMTVSSADSTGTLTYPGIVQEMHTINVAFKTAGQIAQINVKEGDYVREGQLIASLDDADYKLGVEALQIQHDQVSDEVARLRELYSKKSVSANEYEKAEAGLRQLGVQLQVNKNKLAYTKLYAPVSGYLKSVNFAKSEMVDAGTPVISMMDVSGLEVQADIAASEYLDRSSFTSFTVKTPNGETCEAKLIGIVPKADGNQLYRMTLRINLGTSLMKNSFLPGTNVEVNIERDGLTTGKEVTTPLSAICYDGRQPYVLIIGKDSTIERVDIDVEPSADVCLAHVKGIASGTEVVVAGAASLKEGEKVIVLPKPSETNIGGLL